MSNNQPAFNVVKADSSNVDEVERLMKQQAVHHNYTYKGDRNAIVSVLSGATPIMDAFLVYKPDDAKNAVCCVMYTSMWNMDGPVTYLEDICTDVSYRGGGIGKFAVLETGRRTMARGGNLIVGAVAQNNTATMMFWTKALPGGPLHLNPYGLSNMFNDSSALNRKTSYTARLVTGPDAALPPHLHPAATDPTTGVIVVSDDKGDPAAILLANAKFSAGSSTKPGVLVEPVKFLKPADDAAKKDILTTGLKGAFDYAQTNGFTDHFYALADENCAASNTLLNSIGTGIRQESADPGSVLVPMKVPLSQSLCYPAAKP